MVRKTKRRTADLTDKELLADAWAELRGSRRPPIFGRSSASRTAAFSARYRGLCERCGKHIEPGDAIRYHRDFSGAVHSGCRAPDLTVTGGRDSAVVTGTRKPMVCPECHLAHAGRPGDWPGTSCGTYFMSSILTMKCSCDFPAAVIAEF